MCASSCAMMASTCCGVRPLSTAPGTRSAGFSQPTTIGTCTRVEIQQPHVAREIQARRDCLFGVFPTRRRRGRASREQTLNLPPAACEAQRAEEDAQQPGADDPGHHDRRLEAAGGGKRGRRHRRRRCLRRRLIATGSFATRHSGSNCRSTAWRRLIEQRRCRLRGLGDFPAVATEASGISASATQPAT